MALDRVVWNRSRDRSWFRWKYLDNPYVEHVPIVVAVHGDRLVGARPFIAFRLRIGPEGVIGFHPTDTMVHPDHRRRGLFTEMTEFALERYADGPPKLYFNFPNTMALGGYRKLGWREVGPRLDYFRVHNPAPFLERSVDGRLGSVLGLVSRPLARWPHHFRVGQEENQESLWIERTSERPIRMLTSLYRRRIPIHIHAERDTEYYAWNLDSPAWRHRTYVARDREDDSPVAAMIARRRETAEGISVVQIAEVVPLGGDRAWYDAVRSLVGSILARNRDADVISSVESAIPKSVLSSFLFTAGRDLPVEPFRRHEASFAVRPATLGEDDPWTIHGRHLADRGHWQFSFFEHDTA